MAKVNMSSPWVIFYRKIEAMFEKDPDVVVKYDEEENKVRLYVKESEKADALNKLLPKRVTFGNVSLLIEVIPANYEGKSKIQLLDIALSGNPALDYIKTMDTQMGVMNYVVFRNEVVQYFADNMGDAHGVCSTLYQEIAKDIFGNTDRIFYCTNIPDQD